jgi:hypothetical protein
MDGWMQIDWLGPGSVLLLLLLLLLMIVQAHAWLFQLPDFLGLQPAFCGVVSRPVPAETSDDSPSEI